MAITYNCEICGVEKRVPPSTYNRSHRYCSLRCNGIGLYQKYGGKKKCSSCKMILERNNVVFGNNRGKSDKLTTECRECLRKEPGMQARDRRAFIEEKGCKCANCGMNSQVVGFFEIDHIRPQFFEGKRRSRLRYDDKNNLQVLCPNCHKLKTILDWKEIKAFRLASKES